MEMIEEDRPRYRVSDGFKRDENSSREIIGVWTNIKLSIIRDYAAAYSRILSKQPYLRHVYIDAFAGAGEYQLKHSGSVVPGSLRIALDTDPPFSEYFFIDLDSVKVRRLLELAQERGDINVYEGDCNQVLINDVLPRIEYKDYMRALCLLDPYNLSLEWETVLEIAKKRTVDVFINHGHKHECTLEGP